LLVVLVEESATTPHLLTRSGAIYVRNPGSSDPVPIADQRRLLDLSARGERAVERARLNAREALLISVADDDTDDVFNPRWEPTESLVLAPAGLSASFEERLFDAATPPRLARTFWGTSSNDTRQQQYRLAIWAQHHVGVHRTRSTPHAFENRSVEDAVIVTRAGTVVIARGYVPSDNDRARSARLYDQDLRVFFAEALMGGREILTQYGGHGDLRLVYRLDLTERGVWFESIPNIGPFTPERAIVVELDTAFDDDTAESRVFAELLRAVGFGPRDT